MTVLSGYPVRSLRLRRIEFSVHTGLHRRVDPATADRDGGGLEGAVVLLGWVVDEDDDARL